VLVVTAHLGAGHNQVARALVEGMRQRCPQADVTLLDILEKTSPLFRRAYMSGFHLGMTRLPWLYGLCFHLEDHPHGPRRGLRERARVWTESLFMKPFLAFVKEFRPTLVINTHFLPAQALGYMMRRSWLSVRQVLTITDVVVHRWWFAEHVEHWFAPSEYSAQTLRRWGIDPARFTVSGIPIHPKWTAPVDREKVFADWKLPAGRKLVLLSGGAEFTCGPVVRIAQGILGACPEACLCVLAGKNKDLLAALSLLPEAGERLFPVSFTDRSNELVAACTLMVTKGGGLTTAECCAKGTPMVLLKPVPGQEGGNAKYFAREGAAVLTKKPEEVVAAVRRLLDNPPELQRMSQNARRLHLPATGTVLDVIERMISPAAKP
jgi:processive 1,2-diacylglycerol beta-glucosyltransferase